MNIVWYIIAGMLSGVVAGMGMGGGTLLIPVLTIFFSFQQQLAQGINLLAFIPTAIVSLYIHIKNGLVNFKKGLPIIATGILASVGASFLATSMQSRVLQILFGVFLLIIGLIQATLTTIELITKYKNKKEKQIKLVFYTTKIMK